MPYAWCSSKDCDNVDEFKSQKQQYKFCEYCGKPMIHACQNCNKEREGAYAKFCPHCGTSYK